MKTESTVSPDTHYDVIVIGSGMGSLATASLLSVVGKKRVVVLEAGPKLGGFLHSFRRGEYNWDPGVHYVSGMEDGNVSRVCMELVTGGRVRWHQLGDRFEQYIYPDTSFVQSSSIKKFQSDLIARFPDEEKSIRRYIKDMKKAKGWTTRWYISKQFPRPLSSAVAFGRRFVSQNTGEYLDGLFKDPYLKAIVAGQWPDHGVPPQNSILAFHANVATAYFNGGYYPVGGPDSMIQGAAAQVAKLGGKCLRRHKVEEILINDNKAYGVTVQHKKKSKQFFAPIVISGAGVFNTFNHMVAPEYAQQERDIVDRRTPGTSSVNLYIGLNDDPRKHGFEDSNYWLYSDPSYDLKTPAPGELPEVQGAYLSFGSLRDPEKTAAGAHTAQLITFCPSASWQDFKGSDWKKRGDEYEQRKAEMAERMVNFASGFFPNLRSLIEVQEMSTPLTVESFVGHPGGEIYGAACTAERFNDNELEVGTSVKNLYLTGSDIAAPGIDSALMAGVMSASKVLGWTGMMRIMTKAYSDYYSNQSKEKEKKKPVLGVAEAAGIDRAPGQKVAKENTDSVNVD